MLCVTSPEYRNLQDIKACDTYAPPVEYGKNTAFCGKVPSLKMGVRACPGETGQWQGALLLSDTGHA
jgi:hypothetical protein